MKFQKLGNTDIKISSIIMGTWQAGKDMWAGIDDKDSRVAMQAAFDAGITTFDTAQIYGNGHSEKIVGQALKDIRQKVVIATKVFPTNLKYDKVMASCEDSLKNLGTDYIDLYQIHWPPGSFGCEKVPLEETMKAFAQLKSQGKIRTIGVSNFDKALIEETEQYAVVESLQSPYSLVWRMIDKQTAPFCRKKNISILAYSSMAQGLLTGKFGLDHTFAPGDHRAGNKLFRKENLERIHAMLEKIQPIADQHGISLGQLALAWVIGQSGSCAIAGARNADQAIENAKAGDIILSAKELEILDKSSRMVTDHLDDNPLLWG